LRQLNVGLLGIGTVGGGVYTVLKRNAAIISRRTGCAIKIVQIADRNVEHAKIVTGGEVDITDDAFAVVSNPKVDVVIELVDIQSQKSWF
jgi:homoserine dehydrogenase